MNDTLIRLIASFWSEAPMLLELAMITLPNNLAWKMSHHLPTSSQEQKVLLR